MRPGCDRPAAARVAFDPVALQLWLDPLSRRSAPVQELCEFHVERLTIPRGWTATDRRPGSAAANGDVAAIAVLEPVPARTPRAETVEPDPVVEPEPVVEADPIPVAVAPDPEPEPEVAPEPEPVLDAEPEPEPEPVEPEPEPVLDVELEPVDPEPAPAVASALDPVVVVEATPEPEPEPEPTTRPEPEPVAASARPRRPAARRPAARSGRGNAPSLLSRAFELTGHQESILTRAVPEADAEDPQD